MSGNAPALERGILLLKILDDGQSRSLEELTTLSGLPKPSVLRMAETMVRMGLIYRDEQNKRFQALVRLTAIGSGDQSFLKQLRHEMSALSHATGQTVEWYVPAREGMALTEQFFPVDSVVVVRARIGFLRSWSGEFEAVGMAARAFSDEASQIPMPDNMWRYHADGERADLSSSEIDGLIEKTRANQIAIDDEYNSHGVRRLACGVFRDQRIAGVLSVAIVFSPGERKRQSMVSEQLRKTADALSV